MYTAPEKGNWNSKKFFAFTGIMATSAAFLFTKGEIPAQWVDLVKWVGVPYLLGQSSVDVAGAIVSKLTGRK